MGQVTALLTSIGWTLPVLPELDDLTVGKPSDSPSIRAKGPRPTFRTICDGSHPVSAHSALKSGCTLPASMCLNPSCYQTARFNLWFKPPSL